MSSSVPPPPGTPAKKGLGPLGWILIGCGGLIVVGGLVFGGLVMAGGWFAKKKLAEFDKNPTLAAAKLVVQLNPDLEVVSSDEKNGTLTVKNKKTGEVVTINAEDAKNGHIEFKTKDGTASIDASSQDGTFKVTNDKGEVATWGAGTAANLPSWLPSYPGGTVQGTMDTTNAEGRSAAFTMNTKDSTSKVLDYYESQFKAAGFKVDKSTYTANNQTGGSITATSDDQKRTATIMIGASGEETSAVITFQEKK
ncbi:MAG TPA: hypothetical protein VGX68_00025 [Thermoanaerobaculia bacterium]|nr:hypothetical protein [Thermoanaerobaculia bacterium]